MTQISILAYHNGLVVIRDMDDFAGYFCYAKRQKNVPEKITGLHRCIGRVTEPELA